MPPSALRERLGGWPGTKKDSVHRCLPSGWNEGPQMALRPNTKPAGPPAWLLARRCPAWYGPLLIMCCSLEVVDTERALSAPELEGDPMLIPSWYLKRKNYDTVPEGFPEGFPEAFPDVAEEYLTALDEAPSETDSETLPETTPMEESTSVPNTDQDGEAIQDTSKLAVPEECLGSDAGQKVETPGQQEFSKTYLLASLAVSAVLLLVAVVGYIVVYQLLKRDMRAQEDKEASGQDWDASWESRGLLRDETESGEGPGSGERPQANGFRDSCRLFYEIFAEELAQLYKNMRADPSPLTTCPYCALAEGATSRDYWISLESPQPTASWCSCNQYLEDYFMLEYEDD